MRKGKEGLATMVREYFHRDPTTCGEAFIFYNKNMIR
ncbi:IS66 family insertion sequence element accessory protein TnpB [Prevotella stercorea]|nr:IS66 family insertion sequence element accessory protein TnpB [Leyella stercorea]